MKFKKIGSGKFQPTKKGYQGIVLMVDPYQLSQMTEDNLKQIWLFPNVYKKYKTEPDYFVFGNVGKD